MITQSKHKQTVPKARENASSQVATCVSFESDWSRKWREFSAPITERSKAKLKQFLITFDTHLKIDLIKNSVRSYDLTQVQPSGNNHVAQETD